MFNILTGLMMFKVSTKSLMFKVLAGSEDV